MKTLDTEHEGLVSAGGRKAAGMLVARAITVRFEGVTALDQVDLAFEEREILGLIGPNGAGKTTLVNVLSGFQNPDEGSVWVGEREVTRLNANRRVALGISRSFQSTRLFAGLSVRENIELGGLGLRMRRREAALQANRLLAGLGLSHLAEIAAGSLPHGEQRRIGILRALATQPRFLLLDEPASGLDEEETAAFMSFVRKTRAEVGCGILVIEHDMSVIMGLCDRVQVLDFGKTIAVGGCLEIRKNPAVVAAYLGDEEECADASS